MGKYVFRQELKKSGGVVDLVVATPGRLLDIVSDKKGLRLQRVTLVILDEADKMLAMGFEAQVRQILGQIRPDRQMLMLSATMGRRMEQVAGEWLAPDFVRIAVGKTGTASQFVDQHVFVLPDAAAKLAWLLAMLPVFVSAAGKTLVFVNTREGCHRLVQTVRERLPDLTVSALHGDMHQQDRTAAIRRFTKGPVHILIATDVAARGLDICHLQTVVSFDPAKNVDAHVHRVGRAGRLSAAGDPQQQQQQQRGAAYTLLLTPHNADFAAVLCSAWKQEGLSVSNELAALAAKSSRPRRRCRPRPRVGNNEAARTKWYHAGWDKRDVSHVAASAQHHEDRGSQNSAEQGSSHRTEESPHTAASSSPPNKKHRWV